MKGALWIASLSRWAPALAYVIAIGLVALAMVLRDQPQITATHALQRNHRVVLGDLQAGDMKNMEGRYLKSPVGTGKAVTVEMTADRPLPAPTDNTMAAIFTAPTGASQAVNPGALTTVCIAHKPYWAGSKVLDKNCDEQSCQILLQLPANTTETLDPRLLKGASLVAGSAPCG